MTNACRITGITLLAVLLGACATSVPPAAPTPSAPSNAATAVAYGFPLRTLPPVTVPSGAVVTCAGIGLVDAALHGDPNDPKLAWLINAVGPSRIDLVWPSGYSARFDPQLEIVDPNGVVVMREGDQIEGACVTSQPNLLLLLPPFEVGSPWPSMPATPAASASSPVVLCGRVDAADCTRVIDLVNRHLSFAPQATAIVMDDACPADGGCPSAAGFSAVVSIVVPLDPATDYAFWPPTYLANGQAGPDELNPYPGPELPAGIQQLLRQVGFDDPAPATASPSPEASGIPVGISQQQAISIAIEHMSGPLHLVSAKAGPFANLTVDRSEIPSDVDPSRLVWLITFGFTDPTFCIFTPLGQEQCRAMSGTSFVVLDFRTGDFVESGTRASPY